MLGRCDTSARNHAPKIGAGEELATLAVPLLAHPPIAGTATCRCSLRSGCLKSLGFVPRTRAARRRASCRSSFFVSIRAIHTARAERPVIHAAVRTLYVDSRSASPIVHVEVPAFKCVQRCACEVSFGAREVLFWAVHCCASSVLYVRGLLVSNFKFSNIRHTSVSSRVRWRCELDYPPTARNVQS